MVPFSSATINRLNNRNFYEFQAGKQVLQWAAKVTHFSIEASITARYLGADIFLHSSHCLLHVNLINFVSGASFVCVFHCTAVPEADKFSKETISKHAGGLPPSPEKQELMLTCQGSSLRESFRKLGLNFVGSTISGRDAFNKRMLINKEIMMHSTSKPGNPKL